MTGVAYIVRCQHCGVARKSYNDPRRGISVIECKRPCGDSHYDWTYIQTIPESEVWPLPKIEENAIPVYVRPTHPPQSPPSSSVQGRSTRRPCNDLPKDKGEKLQFSSEGRASIARPTPILAGCSAHDASSSSGDSHITPALQKAKAHRPRVTAPIATRPKSRQKQGCPLQ
ncbi:hypothetical protein LSCM1_04396 [Leishmania martiniquensis]|uniref:Uncharacterized protein n=1 Tax=Leishmania martiniquensis TaxID=1580590 RepID=A0A836KGZ5_9TRYP|nr:hypothetical protein LSCM1_04396 [Leishmania martiniquensis]